MGRELKRGNGIPSFDPVRLLDWAVAGENPPNVRVVGSWVPLKAHTAIPSRLSNRVGGTVLRSGMRGVSHLSLRHLHTWYETIIHVKPGRHVVQVSRAGKNPDDIRTPRVEGDRRGFDGPRLRPIYAHAAQDPRAFCPSQSSASNEQGIRASANPHRGVASLRTPWVSTPSINSESHETTWPPVASVNAWSAAESFLRLVWADDLMSSRLRRNASPSRS